MRQNRQPAGIAVVGTGGLHEAVSTGLARLGHAVTPLAPRTDHSAGAPPRRVPLQRHGPPRGTLPAGRHTPRSTPPPDGRAEVVFACGGCCDRTGVRTLAAALAPGAILVNTCPPHWESTHRLARSLGRADVALVSHPQIEGEDTTVADFLHAPCLVLGSEESWPAEIVLGLYGETERTVLRTDIRSADLLPHALNGYLAIRQSYVNALAELCQAVGADAAGVAEALSYDERIATAGMGPAPVEARHRHSLEVLLRQAGAEPGMLGAAFAADVAG